MNLLSSCCHNNFTVDVIDVRCFTWLTKKTWVINIHKYWKQKNRKEQYEQCNTLLTLPEHMTSLLVFSRVHVARSLVFCVMFSKSLYVLLSFFFWSLGHYVDCPSLIYGFWLLFWYRQTLLNACAPEAWAVHTPLVAQTLLNACASEAWAVHTPLVAQTLLNACAPEAWAVHTPLVAHFSTDQTINWCF